VAVHAVQSLSAAPAKLLEHPRIGEKLEEFERREVRRILAAHYEYATRLWNPPSTLYGCGTCGKRA